MKETRGSMSHTRPTNKSRPDHGFKRGVSGDRDPLTKVCLYPQQSSESEVHFDVEIAIKVLRQAGYHSHAVFLAEKHAQHEWYLKIQLEDLKVSTDSPVPP